MDLYIAEIAGKDSVAAVHKFMISHIGSVIIPTIVLTGTEYGSYDSYYASVNYLKTVGEEYGVQFEKTITVNDFELWKCLNVKYQYLINQKYSFYTPCIMCHFYTHLLRVPLLRKNAAKAIITGERLSHSGRLKANQHFFTIQCFKRLFSSKEISLIQPLLDIEDTIKVDSEIESIAVLEHANDVKCILSGNLHGFDLNASRPLQQLQTFLDEFVAPIGSYCLDEIYANSEIDVEKLSAKIMENLQ